MTRAVTPHLTMVRQAREGTYMAPKMKVACAKNVHYIKELLSETTSDPLFLLACSVL